MKNRFKFSPSVALSPASFLSCLLTVLFFSMMQPDANAQSSTLPSQSQQTPPARAMYYVPNGPFVSVEVAKERLIDAMKLLKTTMSQHTEGTGPYNAALRTLKYYSYILENLEAGKGVADSIVEGIGAIHNSINDGVTPEEIMIEKNAAISLLRP